MPGPFFSPGSLFLFGADDDFLDLSQESKNFQNKFGEGPNPEGKSSGFIGPERNLCIKFLDII